MLPPVTRVPSVQLFAQFGYGSGREPARPTIGLRRPSYALKDDCSTAGSDRGAYWIALRGAPAVADTPLSVDQLLSAVKTRGIDAFRAFDGEYCVILSDCGHRRMTLICDHLGFFPLYWARKDGGILAGTRVDVLLEALGRSPRVDAPALVAYLTSNACMGGATLLEGIRAIRPGTALRVDADGEDEVALTRFSFAPDKAEAADVGELQAWTWQVLCEGIQRFVGDSAAPLGVMLSGGVDSALVLAAAVEANGGPVLAYTIDFSEPDSAVEVERARWTAKRLGVSWRRISLDADSFMNLLPGLLRGYDSPATSALGPFAAMSRAAEDGVRVMLTGQGADSVFGLNEVWYQLDQIERRCGLWAVNPRHLGALSDVGYRLGERLGWKRSGVRLLRGLQYYMQLRAGRLMWYSSKLNEEAALELLTPELQARASRARRVRQTYLDAFAESGSPWISDMLTCAVMYTHIAEHAVRAFTNAADALGMTIKHPYLNKRLTDRTFRLPRELKQRVAHGKRIVRQLCTEKIGPELARRPGAAMRFPLNDWLRGPLRHLVDATCDSEVVRRRGLLNPEAVARLRRRFDAGELSWADLLPVVFLELWLRVHVDGADRVDDVRDLL